MGAALSSSTGAALRAATGVPGERQSVDLIPVSPGLTYDVCLPVSSQSQAASLVADVGRSESARKSARKNYLEPLSSASTAGDLYVTQVKTAVARYTKKIDAISADYAKVGKYTKEHAEQMVAARGSLYKELADVIPPAAFYRVSTAHPELESVQAAAREASDIAALRELSGKPAQNLSRNIVKRGKAAVTAADDIPISIDKKIADKLGKLDKVLVVVKLAPAAVSALQAKSDEEREKALKEFAAVGAGIAADKIVVGLGMAFCAAFTVTSLGWGFLVCGLTFATAGTYLGEYAEEQVSELLTPPDAGVP